MTQREKRKVNYQSLAWKRARNRCPTCLEYFNSITGFENHRVSIFAADEEGDRRCLSPEEIAELGWYKNDKGFWMISVTDDEDERVTELRQEWRQAKRSESTLPIGDE